MIGKKVLIILKFLLVGLIIFQANLFAKQFDFLEEVNFADVKWSIYLYNDKDNDEPVCLLEVIKYKYLIIENKYILDSCGNLTLKVIKDQFLIIDISHSRGNKETKVIINAIGEIKGIIDFSFFFGEENVEIIENNFSLNFDISKFSKEDKELLRYFQE